jgi:UTP pyrophosphatase
MYRPEQLYMSELKYLQHYPTQLQQQVRDLMAQDKLAEYLLKRYPTAHHLGSEKALYQYAQEIKNDFMRKAGPLSKVVYDDKIHVIKNALGTHQYISRIQGGKLKAKNEIYVAGLFRKVPLEFLRMIIVHELAHFREKEHNKAFYQLCLHMEPAYHQYEFDLRVYLTYLDQHPTLYP